jgi:hypothetical protein
MYTYEVEKRNKSLFDNAKKHAIEKYGMTAAFDEDAKKNDQKYRILIKKT